MAAPCNVRLSSTQEHYLNALGYTDLRVTDLCTIVDFKNSGQVAAYQAAKADISRMASADRAQAFATQTLETQTAAAASRQQAQNRFMRQTQDAVLADQRAARQDELARVESQQVTERRGQDLQFRASQAQNRSADQRQSNALVAAGQQQSNALEAAGRLQSNLLADSRDARVATGRLQMNTLADARDARAAAGLIATDHELTVRQGIASDAAVATRRDNLAFMLAQVQDSGLTTRTRYEQETTREGNALVALGRAQTLRAITSGRGPNQSEINVLLRRGAQTSVPVGATPDGRDQQQEINARISTNISFQASQAGADVLPVRTGALSMTDAEVARRLALMV